MNTSIACFFRPVAVNMHTPSDITQYNAALAITGAIRGSSREKLIS